MLHVIRVVMGLMFLSVVGFCQTNRGQLIGTVTDASGSSIPGATISTLNPETSVKLEAKSNDAGQYQIYLPFGRYEVRVTANGFSPQLSTGVIISTATTTTLDVTLKLGAVAEEVTVTATAASLDTAAATVGVTVEENLLRDAPVPVAGNTRRPYQYIAMSPAVNSNGNRNSIGGGRHGSTVILLDGLSTDVDNQQFGEGATSTEPSVEAIGEYTVVLNSSAAEYGRTSGGFLTYSTKSGTNAIHGSGWDYLNNSQLSARPWAAAAREKSRSNEFGVAVGGPVFIPKVYDGRNRTFFWSTLGAYRSGASGSPSALQSIPTAAMRVGDFSDSRIGTLYDILDRFTAPNGDVRRNPFPGNKIPLVRESRVTKYFMNLLPLPNRGNGPTLNYVGTSTNTFEPVTLTAKIDHNISSNHRLSGFFQYGTQPRIQSDSVIPGDFGITSTNKLDRWRFDYTWVAKPTLVHTFLVGLNHNSYATLRSNYGQNIGTKAGLLGLPDPNCPEVLLNRANAGQVSICSGAPNDDNHNLVTSISYSSLWNRGSHAIKWGYQNQFYKIDRLNLGGGVGGLTVSAAGSFLFGDTSRSGANTRDTTGQGGFHLADFYLGYADFVGTVSGLSLQEREQYHGIFIQDDWKVNHRLTVNLGLRWDVTVPFWDKNAQYGGLDLSRPNPGASGRLGALTYYGTGQGQNGIVRPGLVHWKDLGPRLGLAYQIDQKTVFRGFAGIMQTGITNGNARFINRTGYAQSGVPPANPDPYGAPYNWDTPFPKDVLGSVPFTDPAFRNNQNFQNWMAPQDIGVMPELYQMSAGFQRQLGHNFLVEMTAYVNLTRHASDHGPVNQLAPQYWSLGNLLNLPISDPRVVAAGFRKPYVEFPDDRALYHALSPYPQYDVISNDASAQTSNNYHAVMFKVQQRYTNGLSFLAHWTIAKQVGDTDWRPGAFGGNPRDQYNRRIDRLIDRFDTPQRLVFNYSYDLPFGPGKALLSDTGKIGKYLLNGWTVAGVHEYMEGFPASFTGGLSAAIPGGPTVRPDRVVGVPIRSNIACGDLEFGNPAKNYLFNAGNPGQAARTGRPQPWIAPGDFQLGNAPIRDQGARMCGNLNENMSVIKAIPITEKIHMVLGGDCINCLNRHRWITNINGQAISAADFGEIQPEQKYGPRVIQIRMRIQW
jgi:hypothetical protein